MRPRRIVYFFIVLLCREYLTGQGGFVARIKSPDGLQHATRDIFQVADSSYIGLGMSIVSGGTGFVFRLDVMGLDKSGQQMWMKTYGGDTIEFLNMAAVRSSYFADSCIYYATHVHSLQNGLRYGALLKIDLTGNIIWQRAFNDTIGRIVPYKINPAKDGLLLCGYYMDSTNPGYSTSQAILLTKLNSIGNEIWRKKIHKTVPDFSAAFAVLEDPPSKKIVLAGKQTIGPNATSFLQRDCRIITDSTGTVLDRTSRYTHAGQCTDIVQANDGQVIVSGYLDDSGFIPRYAPFLYKFKLSSPHAVSWQLYAYHGFQINNTFDCIANLNDSTLLVAGVYDYGDTTFRKALLHTLKIDSRTGKVVWEQFNDYSGGIRNVMTITGLSTTSDGGWIVSLQLFNHVNNPHLFVKFDSTGCDEPMAACQGVGLDEYASSVPKLSVFPNPADSWIAVDAPEKRTGTCSLSVYNSAGVLVFTEQHFVPGRSVKVSELPPGPYLLRLSDRAGLKGTGVFIKQ